MFKINRRLLPIKAHYFFFMAAMGPILPQINVFGKQLGIAPDIMGYITSVLPILFILAKPSVGFLADYFSNFRKFIFVMILVIMTLCYAGFYLVPIPESHFISVETHLNLTIQRDDIKECRPDVATVESLCKMTRKMQCSFNEEFDQYLYVTPRNISHHTPTNTNTSTMDDWYVCNAKTANLTNFLNSEMNITCSVDQSDAPDCLYNTVTFWMFLILMCIGTIGFNVANSISDAVCFDVLGQAQQMKYGNQRVFGTIGFGAAALVAGIAVDLYTTDIVKTLAPALLVMLVCSGIDLFAVYKLKLPCLTTDSIVKDVWRLLKKFEIAIFLVFSTLTGIVDSLLVYFLFWYLEELADTTGFTAHIKLIEGCVVAAECLGGEILFFIISGNILKRIGYVHCLSLCFFAYSVRLGLISLVPNPWWLVVTEFFMQGCTYALSYACIVGYASAVAPPGTSATVQGLVAGMDDGVGYALGSLLGGQLYKYLGGKTSFQIFSGISFVSCIAHVILRPASKHEISRPKEGYEIPLGQNIK